MKVSKSHHIRRKGVGKGKVRHNPKILYKTEGPARPGLVVARIQAALPILMILMDEHLRTATHTKLDMVVKVKHGANTAPAVVQKQYRDLIGSGKVTLSQSLATALDANEGDRVEIVGEAPEVDKQRIASQIRTVRQVIMRQQMAQMMSGNRDRPLSRGD